MVTPHPLPRPLLTAADIAREYGYITTRRVRLAVDRGVLPPPIDPLARPQFWSRAQIDARLQPQTDPVHDQETLDLDKALGIAS